MSGRKSIEDAVCAVLYKEARVNRYAKILAAVSGGADSIVMLHILHKLGHEIAGIHIHHGLREQADSDCEFVCGVFDALKLPPPAVRRVDVATYAKQNKLGIEDAGRRVRYAAFEEERQQAGAVFIATGHTACDSAETVVMNLARGAGLAGLCGIAPRVGRVVRPLIFAARADILAYADENGLAYVTDATNFSHTYARNRTRLDVLPTMARVLNQRASENIAKNARLLRDDEDFLQDLARAAFAECVAAHPHGIALSTAKLLAQPKSIGRRIIRLAIGDVTDISAAHIDAVYDIAGCNMVGSCGGRMRQIPRFTVVNEYTHVVLYAAHAPMPKPFSYKLPPHINHQLHIEELRRTIVLTDAMPTQNDTPNSKTPHLLCTNEFIYDMLDIDLQVRSFLPGDRITLCKNGLLYSKKVKEIFIAQKTPRNARKLIPLLATCDEVIWVMHPQGRVGAKYLPCICKKSVWISVWGEDFDEVFRR